MARKSARKGHPGEFIRHRVIPSGMSVTGAAQRLGIGRPALSNLLNGKSSLSEAMIARLEKAFGSDRLKLAQLAAEFASAGSGGGKSLVVPAYVPQFLTIKARQIQEWAQGNIEARSLLPVLLRKLVNSTGPGLREVDFPGYDNAERRGSDGFVDAEGASPWIPEGRSYWEFGANKNAAAKAESDYAARIASIPAAERAKSTLVFVTPQNWPGKTEWATTKNGTHDWKSVRALDASDLEQWLEVSIQSQVWLSGASAKL